MFLSNGLGIVMLFILASLREESFERNLPFPIAKVVLIHTILIDPTHIVNTVTFSSIAIYNVSGHRIAYFKQLRAVVKAQHGWNPIHGRDPGPTPPSQDPNFMSAPPGFNTFHGFDNGPAPPGFNQPPHMAQFPGYYPPPAMPVFPAPYQQPAAMTQPMYYPPQFPQMNPYGGTWPAPRPVGDGGIPGIHFRNSTGGVGAPPGYDYFFPRDHCHVHIFKTTEKPWQLTVYKEDSASHIKLIVPSFINMKEFMQNVGCTNDDPKKNVLHEVVEKGNGKWASGMRIAGDDKDRMKKAIKDFGWDGSRTGMVGQKPVVWLWVSKDGQ